MNCDNCTTPIDDVHHPVVLGSKVFCDHECAEEYKAKNVEGVSATLAARGSRYGPLSIQAQIEQDLKTIMRRDTTNWFTLSADKKSALEMFAVKISRILSGDSGYADNWHDIQGYAKLIEDGLEGGE